MLRVRAPGVWDTPGPQPPMVTSPGAQPTHLTGSASMRLSNAGIFTKISTAFRFFPAVKYLGSNEHEKGRTKRTTHHQLLRSMLVVNKNPHPLDLDSEENHPKALPLATSLDALHCPTHRPTHLYRSPTDTSSGPSGHLPSGAQVAVLFRGGRLLEDQTCRAGSDRGGGATRRGARGEGPTEQSMCEWKERKNQSGDSPEPAIKPCFHRKGEP